MHTFKIEPVENALLNLKRWRIVRSDGAVLFPFTTRAEAETVVRFFTGA